MRSPFWSCCNICALQKTLKVTVWLNLTYFCVGWGVLRASMYWLRPGDRRLDLAKPVSNQWPGCMTVACPRKLARGPPVPHSTILQAAYWFCSSPLGARKIKQQRGKAALPGCLTGSGWKSPWTSSRWGGLSLGFGKFKLWQIRLQQNQTSPSLVLF